MPADPTMSPDRLVDTGWLADRLAVSREYATDRVTKRPDFPAPRLKTDARQSPEGSFVKLAISEKE